MKLGYVIWLEKVEDIYIKTQVIELLSKMTSFEKHIISFVNYRDYDKRRLKNLKQDLNNKRIDVKFIRLLLPRRFNWYFYSKRLSIIIYTLSFFPLFFINLFQKYDILHFRSYPITFSGIKLKKFFKKTSVIFDTRSPFPEECKSHRRWDDNSKNFSFWKLRERELINKSDSTVVTSEAFVNHINKVHGMIGNIEYIPNNVDTELFNPENIDKDSIRKKFNIPKGNLVFGYVGNLALNSWNCPMIYIDFIKTMKTFMQNINFIFITPSDIMLNNLFIQNKIDVRFYKIYHVEHEDVPYYLSICDFGLNLMKRKDPRLSIKTVEYLALGLPVITNNNVQGVSTLIRSKKLGVVLSDKMENMNDIINFELTSELSSRCRDYAQKNYSSTAIAEKYMNVYKELLDVQ